MEKSRLISQWTIINKDTNEVRSLQHNVRLYKLGKMKQMLKKAGLKFERVYGGYDGKRFSSECSRMIMLTKRI